MALQTMQKRREMGLFVAFVIRSGWCVLALATQSCGSEKSSRGEAHDVLERISRLEANAAFDDQRAAIAALAALPLEDQGLKAMRDVCLEAHQGLLEALVAQDEVRKVLDAKAQPSADELAALTAKTEQAGATRVTAEAQMVRCLEQKREATVRYR
jgi:hypothetical protein